MSYRCIYERNGIPLDESGKASLKTCKALSSKRCIMIWFACFFGGREQSAITTAEMFYRNGVDGYDSSR